VPECHAGGAANCDRDNLKLQMNYFHRIVIQFHIEKNHESLLLNSLDCNVLQMVRLKGGESSDFRLELSEEAIAG
jgi:hypothetical protein